MVKVDHKASDVLVVEDDIDLALLLKSALESDGFECAIANTLADGLKKTQEKQFRFLILDLVLPDGNGVDLLPLLRNTPNVDTTVIISSGNVSEKTRSHPRVECVFEKPYLVGDLVDFMKSKP